MSSRRVLLSGLLALAACGPLPQPFRGRPGELARRLAQPPGYRIAVAPGQDMLLTDEDATGFSRAVAEALTAQEVPAVSGEVLPLDWRLMIAAERVLTNVVPRFALSDADGRPLGMLVGQPVAARDWAEGGEPVFRRIASEAAPRLAGLVARADAQRRTGDERAAGAGPPVLRLIPVRGAPGDGNRSLTERMRDRLAGFGFDVQDQAEGAGFAVSGEVTMAQAGRGLQRVEIVWTVSRRDGQDLGRVLQLNEVPAGSLNGLWGDVAFVVAEEASGGIRDVVVNAGGFGEAGPPPPRPAAQPPATPPRR